MASNYRMYYSSGVTFDIEAEECTVSKRGGRIVEVNFQGATHWAAFTIDDLVAVVEQPAGRQPQTAIPTNPTPERGE